MITRSYDEAYLPPAPMLKLYLITPEWGLRSEFVSAMVDTGADGTLVPIEYLHTIQATAEGHGRLRSQWGEPRLVNLYLVDLEIEGFTLPGIWVIGDDTGQEIVLGRNVLNRLKLLLDGPKMTTTLRN